MKHLSLWLTVLLLGAMPLAAAAFDYGPNQPLLASNDSSTPQLPGAQVRAAVAGEMPRPDADSAAASDGASASGTMDASDDDSGMPPSVASQAHQMMPPGPRPSAPRSHGPSASNKPRQHPAASAAPDAPPSPASWQSLLPGSIQ